MNAALKQYHSLVESLRLAYQAGSITARQHIIAARIAMTDLSDKSGALAANGLGVPYF